MLISLRWLSRHIDLSGLTPEQIAGDLTLSTAEVEGVEPFLPHAREVGPVGVSGLVQEASRLPWIVGLVVREALRPQRRRHDAGGRLRATALREGHQPRPVQRKREGAPYPRVVERRTGGVEAEVLDVQRGGLMEPPAQVRIEGDPGGVELAFGTDRQHRGAADRGAARRGAALSLDGWPERGVRKRQGGRCRLR